MYIKKLTQEIYNMRSTWIGVSLINFFIAALMGFLLRSAFVWEINWLDYLNMLHAHSHVAMLGWVYLVLYGLITDYFVPENKKRNPFYNRLFWFTQFSVLGMMVSFPIQGYGAYSISFSCLHILASYLFVWRIWKDMFISNPQVKILTRSSLVFLLISTLGLWALGPVMASMGKTTALYQVAIQFFLHFQFNGWFAMGVLALVFHSLHQNGVELKSKSFFWFFGLLLASIILTFAHILDWAYSLHFLFVLNGAGVIFQLLSFIILMKAGYKIFHLKRQNEPGIPQQLLVFGLVSWGLKIVVQTSLVIPEVAEISTTIRNFMIGYIHLTMLGFVTGLVFWCLSIRKEEICRPLGIKLFLFGFVGTEAVMFIQGIFYWIGWGILPYYHEMMMALSVLLPVGIFLFGGYFFRKSSLLIMNHLRT